MAATITFDSMPDRVGNEGDVFVRRGTLTLGTYATGGVAVTKTMFDLGHSIVDLQVDSSGGYLPKFDKTNLKVLLYQTITPAAAAPMQEVANSTDVSATVFRFLCTGR